MSRKSWKLGIVGGCVIRRREGPRHLLGGGASLSLESGGRGCVGAELWSWVFLGGASSLQNVVCFSLRGSQFYCPCHPRLHTAVMAQQPPDVEGDDCLSEYHHLFCPDLLQDKVAFVTGGGSGIGFRIAEIFMRHGCHTVIVSRSLQRVTTAAKKLVAATGKRCLPLSMDVRVPPAVMAAVDQALKEFGKIDILISCAATGETAFADPQGFRWRGGATQRRLQASSMGHARPTLSAVRRLRRIPPEGVAVINGAWLLSRSCSSKRRQFCQCRSWGQSPKLVWRGRGCRGEGVAAAETTWSPLRGGIAA